MSYIELENGEKISKGNFAFVFDVTRDICLFNKFLEAEKAFKINYTDFSHKIRIAYEYFAIFEECKRRKCLPDYEGMADEDIKTKIIGEITIPASIINYKNIITGLCINRANDFNPLLLKYEFKRNSNQQNFGVLKSYIKYLYDFGSKHSHVNMKIENKFIPNKENCLRVLASFHDFLNIYYYTKHKFDSTVTPIGDYIAVPEKVCKDIGLNLETGKYLFVKERENKVLYYVLSSDIENISLSRKRDIETINKLWEENFDDPSNIIRKSENIISSNGDYRYQVYSLPGRPLKINLELLKKISLEGRLDIVKGICRGIMSMHEYKPAFYHRNIYPDAFYIFKIKDKYKALLACFDCTKDTSEEALFTVFCNVERKILDKKNNKFFAPEVVGNNGGIDIDWQKADIYALAQTCLFVLTGSLVDGSTSDISVIDNCNVDDNIKYILLEMLSKNPNERPNIDKVIANLS